MPRRTGYQGAGSHRRKLSATVDPKSYAYLQLLVRTGQARNLSHALDVAVARVRRSENRARLERDTAAYFEGLPVKAAAEESRLETVLDQSLDEIDFDR